MSKFSKLEIKIKKRIKKERLSKGLSMREASMAMGLTVKNLEDIEAVKPYGCHITVNNLVKVSLALNIPIHDLIEQSM